MSPHAEIAQRGWCARRWEDREDVLAGWGLRWGYGRGLEEAGGIEVGPSAGERECESERTRWIVSPWARVSNWGTHSVTTRSASRMVNRAGGSEKSATNWKGLLQGPWIRRRLDPRMSTGAIVHSYLDSIAAQVDEQSRLINFSTENRLTDYHLTRRTLNDVESSGADCYVTLTSTW